MARTAAVGVQDFGKIIENQIFYVDKTHFIKEWWDSKDDVTLITRPRRFGKTLAMNMLEYFFSVRYEGRSDLFETLAVWEDEAYRKLQGTYPVIFLSFAGVKANNYNDAREGLLQEFVDVYNRYDFLLESDRLSSREKEAFLNVKENMSDMTAARAFLRLSNFLYQYYEKKVIILLDEYDTPIQEAYAGGYWREMTDFMRGLFNYTFKTNPYLERAVMTGITRVSKESIFSDLNNLEVITAASKKYETAFGFTQREVFQALCEFGLSDQADDVKRWYDGFRFGDCDNIYNPWSVIKFLDEKKFAPYWVNTSSNRLIGRLLQKGSPKLKTAFEDLLQGREVCAMFDEQVVFDQLDEDEASVWGFLLAAGYVKIAGYHTIHPGFGTEGIAYELRLTNLEIELVFQKLIRGWFSVCGSSYEDFTKAFLLHDVRHMNIFMNRIALATISFFDAGSRASQISEPERFYHGLVLGLMVDLRDRYTITSNRESGFGRYDVLFEPYRDTDDGMILEFKVAEQGESLQDTAKAAIRQIINKRYAAGLEQKCRKDKIRLYGFAFRGKEVYIDGGYLGELEESMLSVQPDFHR